MADPNTATSQPTDETTLSSTQDPSNNSNTASAKNMKQYNIYYTASGLNVRLHPGPSSTTPATYYMQSKISLHKPQLLLRRGATKTSPMVAFAKLRNTSRHMLLGKGDCQKDLEEQLIWEELKRDENLLHRSDYCFSTAVGNQTGQRAEFRWRKDKKQVGSTVYDCLDGDGKIVAKMASGGALNWKKGGEIHVLEEEGVVDQGLEEMLLISGLAIWTNEAFQYRSLIKGSTKE